MAIGGYFELELNSGEEYHSTAIRLNSGRNALEYILKVNGYHKIYLPFYSCQAILQPIIKLGIPYQYYSINENLEIENDLPLINKREALLYINYFGLKDDFLGALVKQEENLIIDNAQAFFSIPNISAETFYSARKFFGVPDGAYLYTHSPIEINLKDSHSHRRVTHLLRRIEYGPENGYKYFINNEARFTNLPIGKMSGLTLRLLKNINYGEIAKRRRENYNTLDNALGPKNKLKLNLGNSQVPMIYPFLIDTHGIRDYLIRERIFIPQYWHNALDIAEKNSFDYYLANNLIPLPIDQRYSSSDMIRVINKLERYISS